jgi:hypothetical protein
MVETIPKWKVHGIGLAFFAYQIKSCELTKTATGHGDSIEGERGGIPSHTDLGTRKSSKSMVALSIAMFETRGCLKSKPTKLCVWEDVFLQMNGTLLE